MLWFTAVIKIKTYFFKVFENTTQEKVIKMIANARNVAKNIHWVL